MAKSYFLLMQDDHRNASNKLREKVRKEVHEQFSQQVINDVSKVLNELARLEKELNAEHSRCAPVRGSFYNWKGRYPGAHDFYSVDGLFKLAFYEVKEPINHPRVAEPLEGSIKPDKPKP